MPQSSGIVANPAFIDVVLEQPKEEKQIEISYSNNSNQTITLEFFALDFRQKDEFGTIGFLGEESKSFSYSLSSFLQFETNALVLEPHEKQILKVLVQNREDLSPGGHYSAIIARQKTEIVQGSDAQVAPALSSLVLLRKEGGERFNLSLKELDWPGRSVVFSHPKKVVLTFQNEGNVHLVPYGRLEIRDFTGRLVYKGVVNTSSLRVFPETRRVITVDVKKVDWSLPMAIETVSVTGRDSLEKTNFLSQQSYLYVHPGMLLLLFAAVVVLFSLFRRKKWKKKS